MTKVVRKVRDLTEKNLDIYDEICTDLLDGKVSLSTYRISLFLFEWQEGQDLKLQLLKKIFADISSVINDFEMYDYLSNLRIEFGNEPILFTPLTIFI
jgi:hypothetical protein